MTININHHPHEQQSKTKNKFFKKLSLAVVWEKNFFPSFFFSYLLTKIKIYIYIYTNFRGENVIFSENLKRKCHFLSRREGP